MNRVLSTLLVIALMLISGCKKTEANFDPIGVREGVFPSLDAFESSIINVNKGVPSEKGAFDVMKDPLNEKYFFETGREVSDYSYYIGQVVSVSSDGVIIRNSMQSLLKDNGRSLVGEKFKPSADDNFYESYYEKKSDKSLSVPIFGFNISKGQCVIFSVDRINEYNVGDLIDGNKLKDMQQSILEKGRDPDDFYVVMGITVFLYKAEVYKTGKGGGDLTFPMYCINGHHFYATKIKKRVYKAQFSLVRLPELF